MSDPLSDSLGDIDSEAAFRADSPNHGMFILPPDATRDDDHTTLHVYADDEGVTRIHAHAHWTDADNEKHQSHDTLYDG